MHNNNVIFKYHNKGLQIYLFHDLHTHIKKIPHILPKSSCKHIDGTNKVQQTPLLWLMHRRLKRANPRTEYSISETHNHSLDPTTLGDLCIQKKRNRCSARSPTKKGGIEIRTLLIGKWTIKRDFWEDVTTLRFPKRWHISRTTIASNGTPF